MHREIIWLVCIHIFTYGFTQCGQVHYQLLKECGQMQTRPSPNMVRLIRSQCVPGAFTPIPRAVHLWLDPPGRMLMPDLNRLPEGRQPLYMAGRSNSHQLLHLRFNLLHIWTYCSVHVHSWQHICLSFIEYTQTHTLSKATPAALDFRSSENF